MIMWNHSGVTRYWDKPLRDATRWARAVGVRIWTLTSLGVHWLVLNFCWKFLENFGTCHIQIQGNWCADLDSKSLIKRGSFFLVKQLLMSRIPNVNVMDSQDIWQICHVSTTETRANEKIKTLQTQPKSISHKSRNRENFRWLQVVPINIRSKDEKWGRESGISLESDINQSSLLAHSPSLEFSRQPGDTLHDPLGYSVNNHFLSK